MTIKLTFGLVILWSCIVSGGVLSTIRYSNQPGKAAHSPAAWPTRSALQLDLDKPTLVMFAHPQCPCTRASIGELTQLLSNYPDRLKVYVLFYKPSAESNAWARTDLWQSAEQIPGVTVLPDQDAEQTRLFGSITSGQTLLYNPQGEIIFSGGITAARGHSGDNAGRSAIELYLKNNRSPLLNSLVFGCAITADEASFSN